MTGTGPVNIFGKPIKSPVIPKPAPTSGSNLVTVQKNTQSVVTTLAATSEKTNQAGLFMTGVDPVNIFGKPIKSSALAKPASVVTPATTTQTAAKAVTTPAINEAMFENDGSLDYAIDLANRLPPSEIPKLDMKWPVIKVP